MTTIRRSWESRPRPTARGWSLLFVGIVLTGAGWALTQRDMARVGSFLVALPLFSALGLTVRRPRLTGTRTLSAQRAEVGRPLSVALQIRNDGRRLVEGPVHDAVPAGTGDPVRFTVGSLAPGEARTVTYRVLPRRRGQLELGPLHTVLVEPLGLARRHHIAGAPTPVLVYPALQPLPEILGSRSLPGDESGPTATTAGASVNLREYREGDDLRRVHWRSTARRGELMVRSDEPASAPRTGVLLDNRANAYLRAAGGEPVMERAIGLAASVCVAATERGHRVSLSTLDARGRVSTTRTEPLEALARLEPAPVDSLSVETEQDDETTVAVLGRLEPVDVARLTELAGPRLALLFDPAAPAADALRAAGWDVVVITDGHRRTGSVIS